MRDAKASNWVLERAKPGISSFDLLGTSKGYTSFSRAFENGDDVFYSAHDSAGNREAGWGTFQGGQIVGRSPTATLVSGLYSHGSPQKVAFSGEVEVACTFNAVAFNILWEAFDALPQYVEEAPINDTAYVRANATWVPVGTDGGGGTPILPPSGGLTFWDELLEKPEGISALGYENTVDGGTYGKGIL